MRKKWGATLVAVLAGMAAPAAADAAIRYAEPGGNGPEPCLLADPCEIHDAAQGHVAADVVNGDEITLLPGEYSITQAVSLLDPNLEFHGESGQPRPRIVSTAASGVFANQAGVEISHLEIEQSGNQSGLITSTPGDVTIEDVRVHTFNPNSFSFTCQLTGTVTMRNSVCWSSGIAGAAIGINVSGGTAAVTLRNVTAVSSSSINSYGIFYGGNLATTVSVAATNVIADGVTRDIAASASDGATIAIGLDHSNYNSESETGGGTVTDPGTGTNQTAAPVYLDAATGGFHQASGSPTINQGVNDAANGSFDVDLEPRISNTTTDIGADEFVPTDTDGDGLPDGADSCPNGDTGWASSGATDHDTDGCRDAGEDTDDDNDSKADGADGCPTGSTGWTSTAITDVDSDGCRDNGEDTDDDNDTVADGTDNCPVNANVGQADHDGDLQGDACDADDDNDTINDGSDSCPTGASAGTDTDGDGCKDAGEDADDDNDTVADGGDNCQLVANTDQANNDGDLQGDACDADDDNDTVNDGTDNCPVDANTDQANNDGDSQGDACDADDDNDTVNDGTDNCPVDANTDQANNDGDSQGDLCDADDDNDTVNDGTDNCPVDANTDQANNDGDSQGDLCDADDDNDTVNDGTDNCPVDANTDQANNDGDSQGDACDADDDNDTVNDGTDNCPVDANTDQANNDGDSQGDACDADDDNDTVNDGTDNCPVDANTDQANNDGDSQGDVCDPDDDNDNVADASDNCPTQAGPVGGCPQAATDSDPPETQITKGPPKKTLSTVAKFKFTSDEPGSTFECRFDRAEFAPCTSPVKDKVKRGKRRFEVRAIDPAGNVDATPAVARWKVKRRK